MKSRITNQPTKRRRGQLFAAIVLFSASLMGVGATAQAAVSCTETVTADVVVLDQPIVYNRLGSQNVNGIIYALRRDVVNKTSGAPIGASNPHGNAVLRPDKRPRPLTLRVNSGQCLQVEFANLLADVANPNLPAENPPGNPQPLLNIDDQVAGRYAGFHVLGMQLVEGFDQASFVGQNPNGMVPPGGTTTYKYFAEGEGARMAYSYGAVFGGQGNGGNIGNGMFAVVNVQPEDASYYRSQLTEEERRLATTGTTDPVKDDFGVDIPDSGGQPILDYEARYPTIEPWITEGKAGLPIINMLDGMEIVHSDLNAIIAGPNSDGTFPPETYPLESVGKRNPTVPNRLEAFREFTVVFHDELAAAQAFPAWFNDPVLGHTLHGVRDAFMINYGSGGIGSEIIANRLGVGPMHDCLDCAYEEFFLTAFTVGDIGQLVDVPANVGLEACNPALQNCEAVGPKATKALFPDDPSNVHHSYTGDFVKFRNVHAGPKEHHVFHLHNHQWLFNSNDDNSNYLDAQGIGPGSGYTYEINFGGSGNRNKTAGDAIFHCHFYPHFAMGMWEMWRIHDTLETGTLLQVSDGPGGIHDVPFELDDGTPAAGARALPDGEIVVGTPIPAVVPLPGKPMAPMPGEVTVQANPNTTTASIVHGATPGGIVPVGSNARVIDRTKNPGYPFWIAGIEHTVGQRPTTPPLDMLTEAEAVALGLNPVNAGGFNGGLPRHTLEGVAAGGTAVATQTRLDFSKVITKAKPVYFPEQGTDLEQIAMDYHAQRNHPSTALNLNGTTSPGSFVLNGQGRQPGAPYNEPCIDDEGDLFVQGQQGDFFGSVGLSTKGRPQFGANNPRVYKAANIQFDAVFNKVGYHYPQERIITLWEDALPTINKQRPPEPFVIRLNTFDCAKYLHTNLVPKDYELDDYQVRTPTDIIGQHIHLPKWDLTSADGSANGWNYEDGTLSPGMVVERIHAINAFNADPLNTPVATLAQPDGSGGGLTHLEAQPHPFFGTGVDNEYLGARTTIQRWFADPVVNTEGFDRGLGIIFTHDHYGPSTHQQVGLYGTVLAEPAGSTWKHNETGGRLFTRHDGGPTSWQAAIIPADGGGNCEKDGSDGHEREGCDAISGGAFTAANFQSFREFYLEYQDFQHAYKPGVYIGADEFGRPNHVEPDATSYLDAINPSVREEVAGQLFPDMLFFPPVCPGGVPRPCPEAISADDPGMLVVNYRNEMLGLRVFDPNKVGPDGNLGSQADGKAGDLGFALKSRTDRAIAALNVQPKAGTIIDGTQFPPPINHAGVKKGDPFTPMMRAFAGDLVRVKIQAGAHEETHNATIHGVKWLQGGSGHGAAPNSGWRNAQEAGISEQFTFSAPMFALEDPIFDSLNGVLPENTIDRLEDIELADHAYSVNAAQDGWWSGMWGLLRTYKDDEVNDSDVKLHQIPGGGPFLIRADNFNGVCPETAPKRTYDITAVLANNVLQPAGVTIPANFDGDSDGDGFGDNVGGPLDPVGGTLVYNPRATSVVDALGRVDAQSGPLHDPTGILYVRTNDLGADGKLKDGVPIEPLVLRAAAGECIEVTLRNALPNIMPDLAGLNLLPPLIDRDQDLNPGEEKRSFNNNLIRPSSHVGLHPQLVTYDPVLSDGVNVGANPRVTVSPGKMRIYQWYAGTHALKPGDDEDLVATPVEFGGTNLTPADKIKQGQKGMIGSLIIEPEGATWALDSNMRAAATVNNLDGSEFRDFAVMHQKGINMRYASGSAVPNFGGEGAAGISEDSEDSGQMAINYGTEPLWFRFGLSPITSFRDLRNVANAHEAYSNGLAGGDPVTPVFIAAPGQPMRMRALLPTGTNRGSTFSLHGHVWQRDPYVCPGSAQDGLAGKCTAAEVAARAIGYNPVGMFLGHQESILPNAHFDIVPRNGAGGVNGVAGDYLYQDQASFGNYAGLWGILRVSATAAASVASDSIEPTVGGGGL